VDILIAPKLGDEIDQMAFNKAAFIIKKARRPLKRRSRC